jgi:ribosome maturation factor RimP
VPCGAYVRATEATALTHDIGPHSVWAVGLRHGYGAGHGRGNVACMAGPCGVRSMIEDRTLTYDDLAALLQRSPEATRQLVRRRRWRRTLGNDGKMRVSVPIEALEAEEATEGADVAPTGGETVPVLTFASPLHSGNVAHDVGTILSGHIQRLEAELEALRKERDTLKSERDAAQAAEHTLTLQLAALQATLDVERALLSVERERVTDERRRAEECVSVERQRVEEWKAVADRFAGQVETLTARPRGLFGWLRRRA